MTRQIVKRMVQRWRNFRETSYSSKLKAALTPRIGIKLIGQYAAAAVLASTIAANVAHIWPPFKQRGIAVYAGHEGRERGAWVAEHLRAAAQKKHVSVIVREMGDASPKSAASYVQHCDRLRQRFREETKGLSEEAKRERAYEMVTRTPPFDAFMAPILAESIYRDIPIRVAEKYSFPERVWNNVLTEIWRRPFQENDLRVAHQKLTAQFRILDYYLQRRDRVMQNTLMQVAREFPKGKIFFVAGISHERVTSSLPFDSIVGEAQERKMYGNSIFYQDIPRFAARELLRRKIEEYVRRNQRALNYEVVAPQLDRITVSKFKRIAERIKGLDPNEQGRIILEELRKS